MSSGALLFLLALLDVFLTVLYARARTGSSVRWLRAAFGSSSATCRTLPVSAAALRMSFSVGMTLDIVSLIATAFDEQSCGWLQESRQTARARLRNAHQ